MNENSSARDEVGASSAVEHPDTHAEGSVVRRCRRGYRCRDVSTGSWVGWACSCSWPPDQAR